MLNLSSHVFRHLSDRDTTPLGVHSRRNVHCCQLLEEKLGGVWKDDLCNLRLVLARSAFELVLLKGSRQELVFVLFHCRVATTYAIGVIRPQISQM